MTTTPTLWKSLTKVNTSDAPVPMSGGNANQFDGQVAGLHDGGYVVVWEDNSRTYNPNGSAIVGQRYDAAGNKVGGELNISQFTGGNEFSPAVTVLPNGNIAVAFVDLFNGDHDIYVRIFDSSLNFVRQDNVDTAGVNQTLRPSLTAFSDGSYVVSYTVGSGADTDIVARRVSADGAVGGQFDIDNQTDNRDLSELATLSNGDFVAVYQDEVSGSSANTDIMCGIFTAAGTLAEEAAVPGAGGTGRETDPDVAALRDGGFVVVWSDPDTTSGDIRATILSNAGGTVASDILVNTTTGGVQDEPSVVALADGGFLVTWEDDGAPLVRAQRFDAIGNKIGAEFTVKDGIADAEAHTGLEAAVLTDGRIAFALGNDNGNDFDVATSIWTTNDYDGTPGPDSISASGNLLQASGHDGDDQLDFIGDQNRLFGGSGNDALYANGANNYLHGNAGNDWLSVSGGSNQLFGGTGNDAYSIDNAGDAVIENAGEGIDTVYATAHFRLSANAENLVLQGSADLQAYGNGESNAIYGNTGNNLLDGDAGADGMLGGAGSDVYFVDNAGDAVVENSGEGNDTVFSTAHLRLSANVENLVLQGSADLQGYGNSLSNALYGNSGSNILDGDAGADAMFGGVGNDVYYVDDAGDVAIENTGEGNDTVFSTAHLQLSANVETLVLQGSAHLQGYGNSLANTIFGNTGNNLLNGGAGADIMVGGAGNDVYFVDNALDLTSENSGEGTDAVFSTVAHTLAANVETLVLQGSGDLAGTGNALSNNIHGNSGNNTLNGGAGSDLLVGNAGNDVLVFNLGQADGDRVVDFAGNGAAAGDSLQFVGYGPGATFTNIDATHWQVNHNGGTLHEIITFMNAAAIDPSDFLFS
jgi:Ca2+-binding RTX toxin-like protein